MQQHGHHNMIRRFLPLLRLVLLLNLVLMMERSRAAFLPNTIRMRTTTTTTVRHNNKLHMTQQQQQQQPQRRRLSHAMFRVPSVPDTVEYWLNNSNDNHHGTTTTATIVRSTKNEDGSLKSAFVAISSDISSNSSSSSVPFALELTTAPSAATKWQVGNCVSFIGLPCSSAQTTTTSAAAAGAAVGITVPLQPSVAAAAGKIEEPNGIPVITASDDNNNSGATAAFVVRLGLRTSIPLQEVCDFYTAILGMTVVNVAGSSSQSQQQQDGKDGNSMDCATAKPMAPQQQQQQLCLCYDGDTTALVFEMSTPTSPGSDDNNNNNNAPIVQGNCFDHFVVEIGSSSSADDGTAAAATIASEYERIKTTSAASRVFMKPTTMFGTEIMGVRDPTGYKVILAAAAATKK